jgi:multiple sugar transport system ATP-binding protein
MGRIVLDKVTKRFGSVEVIPPLDLTIEDGEFTVFVGPSGCGKSTLLRLIAGLEDLSSGRIEIDGSDVSQVPPAKRGLAMVFQSYALYPHMSVRKNIAFPLRMAKLDKAEIDRRVSAAAQVLNLTDYLDRRPGQLSGGQRQRVAIGRAIVREPSAFLFDEPLSNLDAALRVGMRLEISELHKRLETTMIYVTHDQVEAMTMADKIVVLRAGNIEQVGSPLDLYHNPRNTLRCRFHRLAPDEFHRRQRGPEARCTYDWRPPRTHRGICQRGHLERPRRSVRAPGLGYFLPCPRHRACPKHHGTG